jgi:periplasmic protein TonB
MTGAAAVAYRLYDLPWTTSAEQERRFRRQLGVYVLGALIVALVLSFLPVPERDPAEVEEIPERFARLLLEELPPPPPAPAVREEPEPEPVVEEPVAERVVEPEPAPVVEPEPVVAEQPQPAPEPVDTVQQARERASVAGLLPFTQELQSLREVEVSEQIVSNGTGGAVEDAAVVPERALIAANVGASSGGISTAALSRNTGGSGIGSRQTTRVESPVQEFAPAGGAATRTGESNLGSRSREEIERVFDRNKGAIYALYNRALRANPTLQGKVVLSLTITPDGRVSACEIVSSELDDPELEQRLVQRVLLFEFDAKDVETVTTTKPIDFFPA